MNTGDLESLRDQLGKRIKYLRENKGFGVRQFALIAEIEHPQLINIEKGRVDLKLATIYKIAKALEMEIKDLFDFIPNQEK